jgi:hypothetical protein
MTTGQGGAQKPDAKLEKYRADMIAGKARGERRAVIVKDLADTLNDCLDHADSRFPMPAACDVYKEKIAQTPIDTFLYPPLKTKLTPADIEALKKAFVEVAVDAYNQGAAGR